MVALPTVAGVALILLVLSDLLSATLGVSNPNVLISQRLATLVWRAVLRTRPSHLVLRLTGEIIVVAIIAGWALTLWAGWTLVFLGAGDGVVVASTGAPASGSERLWFAGYLVTTMGNGDISATTTLWRVAAVLASLTGLVTVTLAVTFLVPVVSGVVQRRQLAATVAAVGRTPTGLLRSAWNGTDFSALQWMLSAVFSDITLLTQRHLAYPVLHYFHAQQRHVAIAPMIAVLEETLMVLEHGVSHPGVPRLTIQAVRNAIHELLDLLEASFVTPNGDVPPLPDLAWLRDLGVGIVDDETFIDRCERERRQRRMLCAFVDADGWSWDDVVDDHDDHDDHDARTPAGTPDVEQ